MTSSTESMFSEDDDSDDDISFDPTSPELLRTRGGKENPPREPFRYISGARPPSVEDLNRFTRDREPGSLTLPATIPLLSICGANPLAREAVYGVDITLQAEDRSKHLIVVGPTGAGKNVRVINTLRYRAIHDPTQSVVSFSLKASDFGPIQKACEDAGKPLIVFNLNNPRRSVGWNPLGTMNESVVFDRIRRFADSTRNPNSTDSDFWYQWVRTALMGAWLAGYRSLPTVYDLFALPKAELIETLSQHGNSCSSQLASYLYGGSQNSDTVLASIVGSLVPFQDPGPRRVMASNQLKLDNLFKQPVCLHVEIAEEFAETHQTLNQMFARTVIDALIHTAQQSSTKVAPATMFFDDMPSLGRLMAPDRLLTLRSREIGIVAGVHSLSSLEMVYGRLTPSMIDNFVNKIVLPGVAASDAEYFSSCIGSALVAIKVNKNQPEVLMDRRLLTADAIRSPSYSHNLLDAPATLFMGHVAFQAYLQKSHELPKIAATVQASKHVTGMESLRKRMLPLPKGPSLPHSAVDRLKRRKNGEKTCSKRALLNRIEDAKQRMHVMESSPDAQELWNSLEEMFKNQPREVLRVATRINEQGASLEDFYNAFCRAQTLDVDAILTVMINYELDEYDEEFVEFDDPEDDPELDSRKYKESFFGDSLDPPAAPRRKEDDDDKKAFDDYENCPF